LLVSRDEAYEILTWVLVAPLTTTIRKIPTAVELRPERDGVSRPSVVILDQIQAIRLEWLDSRIAKLSPNKIAEVDQACRFALGLPD
jgi:mRNA-degrading endonuclease toxin of MazEF toxin-antitoxin module